MKNKMLLLVVVALVLVVIYQYSSVERIKLTENDMYRIKDIYLGNTVATDLDYKVYDINNDGAIDGFDMMEIKRSVLGINDELIIKIGR